MTTFTTDTRTDLNARGRRMIVARHEVETRAWRLLAAWPALFTRRAADPAEELAKVARREAARRATDTLLR